MNREEEKLQSGNKIYSVINQSALILQEAKIIMRILLIELIKQDKRVTDNTVT
jgi:hypothetical protein